MTAYRAGTPTGSNLVPCGRCGTFMDPKAAVYTTMGVLVCRTCESAEKVSDIDIGQMARKNRTQTIIIAVIALFAFRILLRLLLH